MSTVDDRPAPETCRRCGSADLKPAKSINKTFDSVGCRTCNHVHLVKREVGKR
jgi:hypothetical protein